MATQRGQSPLCAHKPGVPAQAVYDEFYVQQGANSEHRVKEFKLGIQADRLSCHTFIANRFRRLLAQV